MLIGKGLSPFLTKRGTRINLRLAPMAKHVFEKGVRPYEAVRFARETNEWFDCLIINILVGEGQTPFSNTF